MYWQRGPESLTLRYTWPSWIIGRYMTSSTMTPWCRWFRRGDTTFPINWFPLLYAAPWYHTSVWQLSRGFDIITGVRQRDVFAPTLYNLFFDAIIATALAQHPCFGVKIIYNFWWWFFVEQEEDESFSNVGSRTWSMLMTWLLFDSMAVLDEAQRSVNDGCSVLGVSIDTKKIDSWWFAHFLLLVDHPDIFNSIWKKSLWK